MAKKTANSASSNLDAARIASISGALRTNAADVNTDVGLYDEAKAAAKAAGEVVNSKRVEIMFVIADLASQGDWTPAEISAASKLAAKDNLGLATEGSVKTFLYEICYAAHPTVRDNFRTLVSVVDLAWTNEQEQIALDPGAAPRPVAKWAKRKYHALTGAMKAAINDGVVIQQENTLIEYAVANDPDHNVGKVFKRMEKLISDLREFNVDFPVDDIGAAIQTLEAVTVQHLTAAQARKLAMTQEDVADIKANTPINTSVVIPSVSAATPAAPKPSPFVTTPVPVATTLPEIVKVDPLAAMVDDDADAMDPDNLLGDNLELAAA